MGAHTLGRNRVPNTGYHGEFVIGGQGKLDNQFYKDIVDKSISWTNKRIPQSSKWQFESSVGTRLNTDMATYYDLNIDETDGSCDCTIGTNCEIADSSVLVEKFAQV